MIKAEQIPIAVAAKAQQAFEDGVHPYEAWQIAFAAGLNAWPGIDWDRLDSRSRTVHIILPLTQESGNE